jgi:hypothetical protein
MEVNFTDEVKNKIPKFPFSKKPQRRNPFPFQKQDIRKAITQHNHFIKEQEKKQEEGIAFDEETKQELKMNINDLALDILTLPMDKERRGILYDNLKQSRYINKYVETKTGLSLLDKMNNDAKFLLIYGYNYFKTKKTDPATYTVTMARKRAIIMLFNDLQSKNCPELINELKLLDISDPEFDNCIKTIYVKMVNKISVNNNNGTNNNNGLDDQKRENEKHGDESCDGLGSKQDEEECTI